MEQFPLYIPIVFGLTVLLAIWLFARAAHYNRTFLVVITAWIALQSIMVLSEFYTAATLGPPRFPLLFLTPILTIIALMSTAGGKAFVNGLDIKALTLFHIIRIPVEIVLLWLFTYKVIPKLMTFEGRNFDILSGLSALLVYYFGFGRNQPNKPLLLAWNIICLALVINIAVNGILSAPTPFQKFAFDQPNIAIGHFPFNLLPSCLVPLVIFSHLASIRQLISKKTVSANVNLFQS